MPSVSQRRKREVASWLQSILMQSASLESWELGSYILTGSCVGSTDEVTLTLSLRPSKPPGSPTSGSGNKAKAETGEDSGSRPGKGRRGGADRGD